jgi:acyl-CoA synthetase (AMP-forming)/AMP-acid ligase II
MTAEALILSLRSITAPIACGNTVVSKPSEWSPISGGLVWGEIFTEAGFPPGVLNVVTHAPGEAAAIAEALVESPHVRRINFTGSTQTGRKLAEAAGRHLKRVVLELGGYNPLIVLGDADLDYAVEASAFGAFLHQGQICMSARKIVVERSIADEFIPKLVAKTGTLKVGDPKEHDTIIGPLINEQALATVKGRVDDAVAKGARVLVGGEAVGPCYQATLITDVPAHSEFANVETFGPVAAIEIVDEAGRALAPGEIGEITVRPARGGAYPGVYTPMLGYWRKPEATREALRAGRYHTGDLGFVSPDGNLYIRGRRNELILRGGANVYPAEVERALLEHPDLEGAAVLGLADERLGERVVAVVQPKAGRAAPPEDALRAFCAERVARYKVPERIASLATLPRNAMGKVMKRELRRCFPGVG